MGAFEPPGSKSVERLLWSLSSPTGKIYENESLLSKGAYRRAESQLENLAAGLCTTLTTKF